MADKVRFFGSSSVGTTPCLRVELYGRPFDNGTGTEVTTCCQSSHCFVLKENVELFVA